jgi:AbrB family looped-hinge helix DNA binding protein
MFGGSWIEPPARCCGDGTGVRPGRLGFLHVSWCRTAGESGAPDIAIDAWEMAGYHPIMRNFTTVDRTGRIVIPKRLRDALRLRPGDAVELLAAAGEVTLRPVRDPVPLSQEMGVWVYRSGTPVSDETAQRAIDDARDERLCDLA